MPEPSHTLVVNLDTPEAELIRQALSSKQRMKLLSLVAKQTMNVNEITAELGLDHSTVSLHIKTLEAAGLILSDRFSTDKGSEKRCWAAFQKITIDTATNKPSPQILTKEIRTPIGLFTRIEAKPECGLASEISLIGNRQNDVESFLLPERINAQIIWFEHAGWVEYMFPYSLTPADELTAIEFSAEICSSVPDYDDDFPSDITLWINEVEAGIWTSPGDFGDHRGLLNPPWWLDVWTQHGMLTTWRVDSSGSYINGIKVMNTTLADLDIKPGQRVLIRIGVKPDAIHKGGLNIFGSRFGDYPQDLILCYHYQPKHSV